MKFNKLNEEQKNIVKRHYKLCMKDKSMDCYKLHKNISEFWESHKEQDFPDFSRE